MAKKMSRRMVVLSISAITTVYLAGYVVTEPVARQIAQAEASGSAPPPPRSTPLPTMPPAGLAATTTPRAIDPAATSAPDSPTAVPTTVPTRVVPRPTSTPLKSATGLTDGTFVGLGRSRRGNVEVALTVGGGKIVTAEISHCMTQYPQSVIDGLPAQVVARQSAQVDLISGATYSSRAFQDAVRQALAQSQQATGSVG
jgi:uncharacterized protein with FMN-binding domain